MKRTSLKCKTPFKLRTKRLKLASSSDTATTKQEIQDCARAIVIARDGGCVLRNVVEAPDCNGYAQDGHLILQADHLITRSNSATYADTRLIVCVCKGHHGWKKWHQKEYEALVRELIGPERAALWQRCEEDSWRPKRMATYDWKLALAALKAEYTALNKTIS